MISSVISLLSAIMQGSVEWLVCCLFLSPILVLMCSGRGWFTFFSLPLGMWCLSARCMRLMMVSFALCTLSEGGVSRRELSISSVNLFQFAFW
jgi:hypothetical protein